MNSIKKIVVVFTVAILMLSFGLATASATSDLKNEKKNNGLAIESKEKRVSTYNIKWDANGGKIGTKKTVKTSVKKGSKINKLVSTPKRTGYSFKGWYSKKSGGSKITTNTKPKKSVTYWAQWTKKRVLNAEEKKLAGWYSNTNAVGREYLDYGSYSKLGDHVILSKGYEFKSDGTYRFYQNTNGYTFSRGGYYMSATGKWHISTKGTIRTTNLVWNTYYKDGTKELNVKGNDITFKYVFKEEEIGYRLAKGIKLTQKMIYQDGSSYYDDCGFLEKR